MKKILLLLALLMLLPYAAFGQTLGIVDGATPIIGGSTGQCVTKSSGGVVTMAACSGGSVTTWSGGTTGLTPNTATSGAVTLAGTLGASNGGTGITSLGTGVATALGVNAGSAGAFVINGGALGTPVSGVATNLTGIAAALTAGSVTTNANLTGVITSVGNATSIASQTGTGSKFVVDTNPTLSGLTITASTPLTMGKSTDPATAPGAGFAKVYWVAGTNGGTCKLISYAGTSTTPVTIVDNVGGGC